MSIFSEYTKYIMVYKAWEASSMASDPLRPDPISTFPSHGHDRGASLPSLPASLHFSACHCLPPLCWYNLHRLLRQSTSPMQFWRNSDQNFLAWKHQVEPVLKAHRLHRFVVSPEIPLQFRSLSNNNAGIENLAYHAWELQAQLLHILVAVVTFSFISCQS